MINIKRLRIFVSFGIMFCASIYVNADETDLLAHVPLGIQKIMEEVKADSTRHAGLCYAKIGFGIDKSIKLSEIELDIPIEKYSMIHSKLDTCKDDIAISDLITPMNEWYLPVKKGEEYLYTIKIMKHKGEWITFGGTSETDIFKKIRKHYPKESGINPIIIMDVLNKILHFPQKGKNNLFYVDYGHRNDSLAIISADSKNLIGDSKKILRYRKRKWFNEDKPLMEKEARENPEILKFFKDRKKVKKEESNGL